MPIGSIGIVGRLQRAIAELIIFFVCTFSGIGCDCRASNITVLCTFSGNGCDRWTTNITVLCTFSGIGCEFLSGAAHHNICRNWLPVFGRGAAHRNKQSNIISGFDGICCGALNLSGNGRDFGAVVPSIFSRTSPQQP